MSATVLLYNFSAAKAAALQALCAQQGIRALEVPAVDQGKPIAALLGLPAPGKGGPGVVPGELLVLSGFTASDLDRFLDAFPTASIPPIPFKAMVTPTNLAWTGAELYLELCKERQAMGLQP